MRCRSYKYYTLILGLAICLSGVISPKSTCADTDTKDNIRQVSLTLSPCDAPTPVMKYRLTVPLNQTRRDNAALVYYIATTEVESRLSADEKDKINEWIEMPLEELLKEDVEPIRRTLSTAYNLLESGAACRICDWQVPIDKGYYIDLPRLFDLRNLGQCLTLKARWEIAHGELDNAIKTIQTGLTFARHVGNDVTLIQSLVGNSISQLLLKQIELLIQQPNAPNLYWALTILPDPMFNWTEPLEYECTVIDSQWPFLKELNQRILSENEARHHMSIFMNDYEKLTENNLEKNVIWYFNRTCQIMRLYPEAKNYLLQKSKSPEDVNAIPALQAVLLYQYQEFQEIRDQIFCWHYVPYAMAAKPLIDVDNNINDVYKNHNPFFKLLPSLNRAYYLTVRIERYIAALRCVEAIRLYAAQNNGSLPPELQAITQIPIPLDPITNQQFIYHIDNHQATLDMLPPALKVHERNPRYEITLR